MPHLIASDLDGTLLSPAAVLSERTIAAVRAAAEAGIDVVAVTGRSHWSARHLLRPAGCIRWIIGSNGATVWDEDARGIVLERPMDDDLVETVLAGVERRFPEVGLAWETSTGVFHTDAWTANRRATDPGAALRGYTNPPQAAFTLDHGPVLKIMLAHDSLVTNEWLAALQPHLPRGVASSTSGAMFVEVTHTDANKGHALAALCADLSVDAADVVAFGDHSNDLPMLAWAGRAYAMANADPAALAVADLTAPANDVDGVAQVIEALLIDQTSPPTQG
ncbi:MAG: Cof-type HAD-IIB family hydrolase [Actinomycetota bacterium]